MRNDSIDSDSLRFDVAKLDPDIRCSGWMGFHGRHRWTARLNLHSPGTEKVGRGLS